MKHTTLAKWYRGEPVFITVRDTVKQTGFIALNMEDGVLEYRRRITDAKKVKQVFNVLHGIGIDVALMTDLRRKGIRREVVWLDGKLYQTTFDIFERYGLQRDFGFNPQRILPLGYWEEVPMEPPTDASFLLGALALLTVLGIVALILWLLKGLW